jgi:hypothetical protein
MTTDTTTDKDREAFETWYDAQPDGRIMPFDVWQAATAAERERAARVARSYAGITLADKIRSGE